MTGALPNMGISKKALRSDRLPFILVETTVLAFVS
jgi:hypothetical protein